MYLKKLAAAAIALGCFMLSACSLPGERAANDDDDYFLINSGSDVSQQDDAVNYKWALQPSVTCDNIIVPDGSMTDPNNIKSKAYMHASIICQDGKYGFIDYEGAMIVYPEYSDYYMSSSGEMVLYNINEETDEITYCTLDSELKKVEKYKPAERIEPEYFWSANDSKIYVHDRVDDSTKLYTGEYTVVVRMADVTEYDGSLTVSNIENSYALAKGDQLLTAFEYSDYWAPIYQDPDKTCIAVEKNGKWGYLDGSGKVKLDFIFNPAPSAYSTSSSDSGENTHPFLYANGYLPVLADAGYGYYTETGDPLVLPGEFQQTRPVQNGRAWVCKNGLWGIIQLGDTVKLEVKHPELSSVDTSFTTTTAATTTTTEETTTPPEETSEEVSSAPDDTSSQPEETTASASKTTTEAPQTAATQETTTETTTEAQTTPQEPEPVQSEVPVEQPQESEQPAPEPEPQPAEE